MTKSQTDFCYILFYLIAKMCIFQVQTRSFAGGPGYGLYFDSLRPDVVGFKWNNAPANQLTVEFWLYAVDPWQPSMHFIAYSVFDATQTPIYQSPDEFWLRLTGVSTSISRTVPFPCSDPQCVFYSPKSFPSSWVHLAVTWDVIGHLQLFKNGKVVLNTTIPSSYSTFFKPMVNSGCIVMGQEADSTCGGFDELQQANGIIDELRMWNYVRSPAEIQASMNTVVDPTDPRLTLYFRFDNYGAPKVPDLTGNGNDGLVGALPSIENLMVYYTPRGSVPPTSPRWISTSAPLYGTGIQIIYARQNFNNEIYLQVYNDVTNTPTPLYNVTISQTPTKGVLMQYGTNIQINTGDVITDPLLRVIYFTTNDPQDDSFNFTVDGTAIATVFVNRYSLSITPNFTYTTGEEIPLVITLGSVNDRGEALTARLVRLPSKGQLYQVKFKSDAPNYNNVELNKTNLIPILSVNDNITNPRGILIYFPPFNQYSIPAGSIFDTFEFTHYLDSEPQEGVGTVNIIVYKINYPPKAYSQTINIENNGVTLVTLNATDVDTGFNSHLYFEITKFPNLGKLYQADENGTVGSFLNPATIPTVTSWATRVFDVSSQYSRCPHCYYIQTCTGCSISESYSAQEMLGPTNVFPKYGDYGQAFEFLLQRGSESNPVINYYNKTSKFEYMELGFYPEMYISLVEIYETFTPGSIVKIFATNNYEGQDTIWETLWEGEFQIVPAKERIMAPNLCFAPYKSQAIRIECDTYSALGYTAYDAVKFTGTIEWPRGKVASPIGQIWYEPPVGIYSSHGILDSFTYIANDCDKQSTPATVNIYSAPKIGPPFNTQNVAILNSQTARFTPDLSPVLEDFGTRFPMYNTSSFYWKLVEIPDKVYISSGFGTLSENSTFRDPTFLSITLNDNGKQSIRLFAIDNFTGITYGIQVEVVECDSVNGELGNFSLEGLKMYQSNCVRPYVPSIGLVGFGFLLSALGSLVTILSLIYLIVERRNPVMIRASVNYMYLFHVGVLFSFTLVGIFSAASLEATNALCVAQPILGSISFGCVFSVLLGKTLRIHLIFSHSLKEYAKKNKKISPKDDIWLLRVVLPIVILFVVFCTVWACVDPPQAVTTVSMNIVYTVCSTQYSFWIYIFGLIIGVLLLWGIYLAWVGRNLPDAFNEGKWVGSSIYTVAIFGILMIPLGVILYNSPEIILIIETIPLFLCSLAILLLNIFPRIWIIFNRLEESRTIAQDIQTVVRRVDDTKIITSVSSPKLTIDQ